MSSICSHKKTDSYKSPYSELTSGCVVGSPCHMLVVPYVSIVGYSGHALCSHPTVG